MVSYMYSWAEDKLAAMAYWPLALSVSFAAAALKSAQVQEAPGYLTPLASNSSLLYHSPTVSKSFGRPECLPLNVYRSTSDGGYALRSTLSAAISASTGRITPLLAYSWKLGPFIQNTSGVAPPVTAAFSLVQ